MIKKTIVTAAVLLTAVFGLTAQNKSAGINLSIWKGVATQPLDSTQTTYFNLGFASTMNRLNGLGVNILAGAVHQEMNGMQVAGIANLAGNMRGLQVAGITNITGDASTGMAVAGMLNISGDKSRGILVAGLGNITGESSQGLIVSGLTNIMGDKGTGLYVAGLANISGESLSGVAIGGLFNVTGTHMRGVQISPIGNVVGGRLAGVQIGLSNLAEQGSGLQIGLVNYYRKNFDGLQLGLANLNPRTRYDLMVYGGNDTQFNVGMRFRNDLFYTIVGVGAYYLDTSNKFSATWSYRAGLELPLYKDLFISGDLGFQQIELLKNTDNGYPRRLYELQARLNMEYRLTERLGLFVTGGYGKSWAYTTHKAFRDKVIFEVGTAITLSKIKE